MELIETLNRTMKLALDDGSAASVDEAEQLFRSFHLQILIGHGVANNRALQAALVTLLNAAPRTFLGEVTVAGQLDFDIDLGWHRGQSVRSVADLYGVPCSRSVQNRPSIVVGQYKGTGVGHAFELHLACTATGFVLTPDRVDATPQNALVAAGVAGAGAALSEYFQHIYFRRASAGQRVIKFALPSTTHGTLPMPKSIWVVGLGHLGQAFLWTTGLAIDEKALTPSLILQDYDRITNSSLSTGLLTRRCDVHQLKAHVTAAAMKNLNFTLDVVPHRVDLERPLHSPADACVVAVDSFGFRRQLDKLRGPRIVEGGIGDGIDGFTKAQIHVLPGRRTAAEIWSGDDPRATRHISIAARAYKDLLRRTSDECGTTQLAGRSIATPFIGAFVGALLHRLIIDAKDETNDSIAFDVNAL